MGQALVKFNELSKKHKNFLIAIIGAGIGLTAIRYLRSRSSQEEEEKEKESGSCCPSGSVPCLQQPNDYTLKGNVEEISGLKVYISGRTKNNRARSAVLVASDIYGFNSGRIKQICDQIASHGYLVILVDFYHGDAWTAGRDKKELPEWVKQFTWPTISDEINSIVLPFLKKEGASRFGVIGLCWGSWIVMHACASSNFSVGVSMHPSHPKLAKLHKENEEELLRAVKSPQMMLSAGNDLDSVKPGGLADKIFTNRPWGQMCEFHEFPKMKHGWVPRGDISDPDIKQGVSRAVTTTIDYLYQHLPPLGS